MIKLSITFDSKLKKCIISALLHENHLILNALNRNLKIWEYIAGKEQMASFLKSSHGS